MGIIAPIRTFLLLLLEVIRYTTILYEVRAKLKEQEEEVTEVYNRRKKKKKGRMSEDYNTVNDVRHKVCVGIYRKIVRITKGE